MNHKDRIYATIHHQPVDRPAAWLGLPVPSAEPALMNYFGVNSVDRLREVIDDDIYPIEVPYHYPPSHHIACAFNFAKVTHLDTPYERTLMAPGLFHILIVGLLILISSFCITSYGSYIGEQLINSQY